MPPGVVNVILCLCRPVLVEYASVCLSLVLECVLVCMGSFSTEFLCSFESASIRISVYSITVCVSPDEKTWVYNDLYPVFAMAGSCKNCLGLCITQLRLSDVKVIDQLGL